MWDLKGFKILYFTRKIHISHAPSIKYKTSHSYKLNYIANIYFIPKKIYECIKNK